MIMSSTDQTGARDYPFYGNVRPLLGEVLHAVDRLLDTGEPTTIDLAGLPFGPGELEHLEEMLGTGEVTATLDALGTAISVKRPVPASGGSSTATPPTKWLADSSKSPEHPKFSLLRTPTSLPAALAWRTNSIRTLCGRTTA